MRLNRVLQLTLAGALWLGFGGMTLAGPGTTAATWSSGAGTPLLLARHDDHPRGQRGRGHDRHEARGPRHRQESRGRGHDNSSRWRHAAPPRGERGYDKHPRSGPPRYGWGPPPKGRWSRGDVLPRHYRQPHYVVNDWRARRYAPPPRGHQWMRIDGEALLVGIATGLILQSIIDR